MSKHMKTEENGSGVDAPDEYSRDNVERYSSKRKKHATRRNVVRGIVIALVAVLVGGGTAFALWINNVQTRMNNSQVITPELQQSLASSTEDDTPATPNDPYYVLLLGTDGRPGETDYRADTIILARIDPPNKRVTLLSIPRDTMVEWKGTTMKINGVHTYDGAAGMVQIVSEKCGVQISHYAEIAFDGLSTLTDAMGGVTVDVDQHIKDTENFDDVTELQPGVQTLNGAQALFYCRCRHFPDGDYTRMRHQRAFIKAMLNQLLATDDPTKIVNLVNATADVISTDLSVTDIVTLASEMVGMDTESDIYTAYVPSEPKDVNGVAYVVADWDALDEMMKVIDAGEDPSSFDVDQYGYNADDSSAGSDATTSDSSTTTDTTASSTVATSQQSAESTVSSSTSAPKN
ncbi:LytR family transcriptional regulator [Olsenella sp. AF16-14LB]|jgi:LCP family protein required for cell wall assembly|uniref:LCP family protein n=1 Tax=Atopobiaceae TaxID=1643824 RepID=UPI0005A824B3|nr:MULTISPECIES: LCP family protein [unclassified Olsenella]RGJ45812.1 LytR family transcriptional regulator [Olsenella sp. TM06-36]RGS50894.1 LytR family transcriptional regulator [Olsenella sp. AF21-51]RGU51032.1 LytR family transcriptional regulator [Olsenella sp. AF16-14LB]RGU82163.1 LytR family transcriptional regulator [Olsenella sp. AF15-43LB]RHD74305.1 LytR family transcriptional regulator [Olsenella sp. AM30-3LB]